MKGKEIKSRATILRSDESIRSSEIKRMNSLLRGRLAVSLLFIAICVFPFASRAHEPITTKVRFNKELVRILQRNCLSCHHPGGIAMSLATYEEARPWAKAIKEEVLEKRMPPWRAVKGYGDFRNAPSLTQRDVDLIANWVEGGAPKGDDKDLPPGPLFSTDWQLGQPDLILKPPSESKIAADADECRKFVLPTNLKETRWLSAIDLKPGNAAVVRGARIQLSWSVTGYTAISGLQRSQKSTTVMREVPAVATWLPGQKVLAFDEGTALRIPANTLIEVTIHYRGSGEAVEDRSSVGLYFAKSAPRNQLRFLIQNTGASEVIQVSKEPQRIKQSLAIDDDIEGIGIRPLVHPLIASIQATAYRPDGSEEVLIWTRGYQFDWEPTYYFKKPVTLPKGTRVEVIAYFDNSDDNQNNPDIPPRAMRLSELSSEPLCTLLVAISDAASTPPATR
jgi:hypothetical protein